MPQKVIIDTDPGIDDAMAIQLALSTVEIEILGLTTIFGNVGVEKATQNALRILEYANRSDIPVAKGAKDPLFRKFDGGVPNVHGKDGQGNTFRPLSQLKEIEFSAHDFMAEQILRYAGEVSLITLGPLTNVALLLRHYPGIESDIRSIVVMGGNAFCPGNATPSAEANIWGDPDAADQLLGVDCDLHLVGLDVTQQVLMSDGQLERIAKFPGTLNSYVTSCMKFYREFYNRVNKIDGILVHDSSAVTYFLRPDLFTTVRYPVRVETADCISLGKTWPSLGESDHEDHMQEHPWSNRPLAYIAREVNSAGVLQFIEDKLKVGNL